LDDIKIKHAHQTFVIGTADINIAKKLDIALNSPTAEAHCVVVDDSGVAIYVADIIYRGECVKFDINLLNTGHKLKP
jgi:GntR family transcriptional regulator